MENEKKVVAIIPARMASTRLPGKPMIEIKGKPLLWHTYMAAKACKSIWKVLVTSPDKSINQWCEDNGLAWFPSTPRCPTGTHRCAEVASLMDKKLGDDYVVVNWQVDEPMVEPEWVDLLVESYAADRTSDVGTLVAPANPELYADRDTVKVAVSYYSQCMWFSRAPMAGADVHCGVYVYSYDVLRKLGRLQGTKLSESESLEQLAWIENAFWIDAIRIPRLPLSVNSPRDLERLAASMEEKAHG